MYKRLFKYVIPEQHLTHTLQQYKNRNVTPILDYLVEHNTDRTAINQFIDKKLELFEKYPNSYHSIKLSSLNFCHYNSMMLAKMSQLYNVKLLVDAENFDVQHEVNRIINRMIDNGYDSNVFKTYQMYRKDMYRDLMKDLYYHQTNNLVHNIKLVRGAYIIKDINKDIIHGSKRETDRAFNDSIDLLIEEINNTSNINLIVATHNMESFEKIRLMPSYLNIKHAALMGMDRPFDDKDTIVDRMVHIPFGPLYKAYPYMFRRFVENNPVNDHMIEFKQKYTIR